MTDVSDRAHVERLLRDPALRVPEADAAATRPAERFRARASRFVNGARHEERRRRLEQLLADIEPDTLTHAAAARTRSMRQLDPASIDEIAAQVPVACLAASLGFDAPDTLPPLVAVVAAQYPTGGSSDAADAAIERLLAAAPSTADDDGDSELHVQLLVQACAATAGLIMGALHLPASADPTVATFELLATTLRDEPPVAVTRRISPDDQLLVLHLDGPDRRSPHVHSRTLAFGAGPRACPAPHLALAIASAVVDGLRAC